MKKINNKGFVLAETLVVTVFLMVIFSMIYSNFYPLIGEYEKREAYDDVDGVYSAFWLKRLIEDESYHIDAGDFKSDNFAQRGFMRFECSDVANDDEKRTACINLVKEMEVEGCDKNGDGCNIFITRYRIGGDQKYTNFKDTVEKNMYAYEENCINGDNECKQEYITKCVAKNIDEETCKEKSTKKIFSSGFQDYVFNLPDYSVGSLNYAQYRVIVGFKHKNDNNNYNSYSTIEVSSSFYIDSSKKFYSLRYDLSCGTVNPPNPASYSAESEEITLRAPKKDGYTFTGWTGSNGTTPELTVTIPTGSYGNKSYKSNCIINKATIKMRANSGTLQSAHGAQYSLSGDSILYNSSENIHVLEYGQAIGGNGLIDYNNASALNLTNTAPNNIAVPNKEWKCISGCSMTYYDQSVNGYNASDFCDVKESDCTAVLGVNWADYSNYVEAKDIPTPHTTTEPGIRAKTQYKIAYAKITETKSSYKQRLKASMSPTTQWGLETSGSDSIKGRYENCKLSGWGYVADHEPNTCKIYVYGKTESGTTETLYSHTFQNWTTGWNSSAGGNCACDSGCDSMSTINKSLTGVYTRIGAYARGTYMKCAQCAIQVDVTCDKITTTTVDPGETGWQDDTTIPAGTVQTGIQTRTVYSYIKNLYT